MSKFRASRRGMILGGAGAAALIAGGLVLRKPDRGGGHDAYFLKLQAAMKAAGLARPTLVVDRQRLAANVEAVKKALPASQNLRVVVKSLPSLGLMAPIAAGIGTNRYMVFNGAMTALMARERPDGDYLLGKPLPAAEAAAFYRDAKSNAFDPSRSLQWLIDTPARLAQYAEIAAANGQPMKVNLEIDVGLHRGGFADQAAFAETVDRIRANPGLHLAGLMGYDPHLSHVSKGDSRDKALAKSRAAYQGYVDILKAKLGGDYDPAKLTLNTAGSPTYRLHHDTPYANDISVGSAFVKPQDFDVDTLADHVPAAFIATPVIKALPETKIPTAESLSGLLRFIDPNTTRAFFIYGGHWLAKPTSPPGLEYSSLFGRSSNQELLTGSAKVDLKPDDYIFLRPTQSEAVFLQFGDIAVFDGEAISETWPVFPASA